MAKLTEVQTNIIRQAYVEGRKLSYEELYNQVNQLLILQGHKTVSHFTLRLYLINNVKPVFIYKKIIEGQIWIVDTTRLINSKDNKGNIKYLLLMVIMDRFSSRIIGYSINEPKKTELVHDAFTMAIKNCSRLPDEIHLDNSNLFFNKEIRTFFNELIAKDVKIHFRSLTNSSSIVQLERFFWKIRKHVTQSYWTEGIQIEPIYKFSVLSGIDLQDLIIKFIEQYNTEISIKTQK